MPGARDPLLSRLRMLTFRVLSLGLIVLGSLAVLVAVATAAVLAISGRSAPGFSLGTSAIFFVAGSAFALIGIRGFRMKRRQELLDDITQTASDRDTLERWINREPRRPSN